MELAIKLREETSIAHRKLESLPIFKHLLSDELNEAVYQMILINWHRIHSKFDVCLKEYQTKLQFIPYVHKRLKTPLLEKDLIHFRVIFPERPLESSIKNVDTIEELLGYMYVFEGSTLGGHQITKHVKKILPVSEESGVSFYNSYGQDLGHYWSSFSEAVNQWGKENPDKHELVIASANRCFDEIHQSFFNLNPKNIA